ncbi:MAG: hypothetical protein NVS1B7_2910 [Candidatus Saccharimonadales bacterium]
MTSKTGMRATSPKLMTAFFVITWLKKKRYRITWLYVRTQNSHRKGRINTGRGSALGLVQNKKKGPARNKISNNNVRLMAIKYFDFIMLILT